MEELNDLISLIKDRNDQVEINGEKSGSGNELRLKIIKLIESVPNYLEDGIKRIPKAGLVIYAGKDDVNLSLSTLKNPEEGMSEKSPPLWQITLQDKGEKLVIGKAKIDKKGPQPVKPTIEITEEGMVVHGTLKVSRIENLNEEKKPVTFTGEIEAIGFKGGLRKGKVAADGQKHVILEQVEVGAVYRVTASFFDEKNDRSGLLDCVLSATGSTKDRKPFKRINYGSRWFFGKKMNQLEAYIEKDENEGNEIKIKLASKAKVSSDCKINYRIEKLFDAPGSDQEVSS